MKKIPRKIKTVTKIAAYNAPGSHAIQALNESGLPMLQVKIKYPKWKSESNCLIFHLEGTADCHDCGKPAEYGIYWLDDTPKEHDALGLLCGICEIG